MRKLWRHLLVLTLALHTFVVGEVVETNDIRDLLKYADAETLVVSDINEVLLEMPQMLGSGAWARWKTKQIMAEEGISRDEALHKLVPHWHHIILRSDLQAVERTTPWVVRRLQQQGIPVVALTNNYIELAYSVRRNLLNNHIDLTQNAIYPYDLEIEGGAASKYVEGAIFVGLKNDKGGTLLRFLDQIGYAPKKIVYIDDKEKNARSVDKACQERGIPCVALRYGYLDEKVAAFDPAVAGKQEQYFEQLLADELAEKLIVLEEGCA